MTIRQVDTQQVDAALDSIIDDLITNDIIFRSGENTISFDTFLLLNLKQDEQSVIISHIKNFTNILEENYNGKQGMD